MSAVWRRLEVVAARVDPPQGDASLPLGPLTASRAEPTSFTAAGLPPRLAAWTVDAVCGCQALAAAHGGLFLARGKLLFDASARSMELFLFTTVSLPCWCYFASGESSRMATLGKRLIGLRVVDVYGSRRSGPRLGAHGRQARTVGMAHVAVLPEPVFVTRHLGYRPALFVASRLGRSVPRGCDADLEEAERASTSQRAPTSRRTG